MGSSTRCRAARIPSPRLDLSASYNVTDRFTLFFDWTNILKKPFTSDIVRTDYGFRPLAGPLGEPEVFPMVTRFEETILSGGIRFNFGGPKPAPAAAPVYVPPPPPPVAAPPPVEQPAPRRRPRQRLNGDTDRLRPVALHRCACRVRA